MTKKKNEQRHIQNRTWEKDRRDRLNITFEKLAKLLPEYQPKISLSKIEILQKSIIYIEDLREKMRDLLSTKHESILKTQTKLENSLKVLIQRNDSLVELLQKSNILVPHFVEPKCLSFIIAVHDGATVVKKNDENLSAAEDKICHSMQEVQHCTASKPSDNKLNSENDKTAAIADEIPINQPANKLPELSEIKKFGSVEVIPVTNANKFEIKVHQQLVKNTVEITPLLPHPSSNTAPEKMTYSPSKESIDSTNNSSEATKSSTIKLDDNVPIPEQCVDISKTCDNQMVNKDTEVKVKVGPNKIENHIDIQTTDRPADVQQINSNENEAKHINKSVIEAEAKDQPTNSANTHKVSIDNLIASKIGNLESDENIANEKDLADELFGHFPLPQTLNESNPNTLSPTAAFLLSFPVVSTASSSKPTESEITFTDEKQNQSKDHNLFESISSILNDLNEVPDGDKTNEPSNDIQFTYCNSKGKMNSCAVVGSQSTHSNHSNKNKVKSFTQETFSKALIENNGNKKNDVSRTIKEQFVDNEKPGVSKITKNVNKKQSSAEILPSLSFPHHLTSNKLAPKSTLPIALHSNENHSDFYESLSTLGLPIKSTLASTSTNNTVSSHFNFQISSLTQPRNIIESRALIADPPFTFSLTKSTETVTKTIDSTSSQTQTTSQMNKISKKPSPAKQTTHDRLCIPSTDTKTVATNRNNTYNPFSFDNPPVLSTPSSMSLPNFNNTCSAASMSTSFTFTLTPTFSANPINTPLLSNTDSLYSSSIEMPLLSVASVPSKHFKKDRSHLEMASDKMSTASNKNSKHFHTSNNTKHVRNHVNWMTSCMNKPITDSSSEFGLISHANSIDDHSAWSDHHRIVDNAHIITTPALPMLQGDLALNTITNNVCSNVQKHEVDNRKPHSKAISPIKAQSKQSVDRKIDYSSAGNKFTLSNKNDKNPLSQPSAAIQSIRLNENQSTNNFHSVSQLLDQDRQNTNKMNYFNAIDDKQQSKDLSFHAKQKFHSKYDENNLNNHQFNDKFGLHSSGLGNNVGSNDCDRDIFGGYFFSQSKRLKLNYSSSDYASANNYDNSFSNVNDIHPPYTNYQTYDNEFNAGNSSCTNQTYPYQYGQTQTYQPHQQYHASHMIQNPTESIDPIILPQNFFQTPATLSNYKPPNFTEMVRTNTKPNIIQQSHSNHSKSSNQVSSSFGSKSMLPPTNSATHINDIHASHPSTILSESLNKSPCKNVNNSSKSMHFTSHSNNFNNLNNLSLNQSWNDSFSWIPYSNSIEKPYNCNLFNNNENSTKTFNSNNMNNTNNTIPNFNLTTIFPDCNKS